MRILFLCKRQYIGVDLLDQRYGRLYELPVGLAALGHQVEVVACSYRRRGQLERLEKGVRWHSVDAFPWPGACIKKQVFVARAFAPEIVFASSDALHLIAGRRLAESLGVPSVLDLYDDYEAFGLTRLPRVRGQFRKACQQAQAITAVGHRLRGTLVERGVPSTIVHVLPNGVPAQFGVGVDRVQARKILGLPAAVRLFGTAGALDASRGIADLVSASRLLAGEARLVIAGRGSRVALGPLPDDAIDLGSIPHDQVAQLFRALDVGVVCNRDSLFGRHCHPMKLVEMARCGLSTVAAAVGEAELLLGETPRALYRPGDATHLAERVRQMLTSPQQPSPNLARTWDQIALDLERVLVAITAQARCN